MDHPNRDDYDEKVIGSRKRKINLVQQQKSVDAPVQEREETQHSSGGFSGITKWLTGGRSEALEGFGGPPVVEVVYEPKGGDEDFMSSIDSPRSDKDFLSSINSGDEALLTSGDEFLSCTSDNDDDGRLEESVGSKKRKQSKPNQHLATPPASTYVTTNAIEEGVKSSNVRSDESDSSFATPDNSWYDGNSTPPTVVRKTVSSPPSSGGNASGTPLHAGQFASKAASPPVASGGTPLHRTHLTSEDTSPREYSKVVTEKHYRKDFDGRNIREEFSHKSESVRSESWHSSSVHKKTTETVIHKSSHEGSAAFPTGGGIATAFKDVFNVAAAAPTGHSPAMSNLPTQPKIFEGNKSSTGSDIAATVKDMFNNVAAAASHVLGTGEKEKVATGISSALKGMGNIAAVASPVTHVSCEMRKDIHKDVSPAEVKGSSIAAGISSALKGMGNVAAVASPRTHVTCEIGKDHSAKTEGKDISNVAARIKNISNQSMKITSECLKNQRGETGHGAHSSPVHKTMVSDNTLHQVTSGGISNVAARIKNISEQSIKMTSESLKNQRGETGIHVSHASPVPKATVSDKIPNQVQRGATVSAGAGSGGGGDRVLPVTKDEIKMSSAPITFVLKESDQGPVKVTAGNFMQTSKDNIKITSAYSVATPKDQMETNGTKQSREGSVSAGEIKITGAYSIAHIPKSKIDTAAHAAAAMSLSKDYGQTAGNRHCGTTQPPLKSNLHISSVAAFPVSSQPKDTIKKHVGADQTSVSKEVKIPTNPSAPITFVLTEAAKAKITQEMNVKDPGNVIGGTVAHLAKATSVPVTSVLKEMVQSKVSEPSKQSGDKALPPSATPITFVLKDTAKEKVNNLAKKKDDTLKKTDEIVDFTIENVRSLQAMHSLDLKLKNEAASSTAPSTDEDMDISTEKSKNIDMSMDMNESISSPTGDEYEGREKRKYKKRRRTSPVYPIVYSKRKRKRDCVLLHEIYRQNIDFIMSPPPVKKVQTIRSLPSIATTPIVATPSVGKVSSKTKVDTPVQKKTLSRKVKFTSVKVKPKKAKVSTAKVSKKKTKASSTPQKSSAKKVKKSNKKMEKKKSSGREKNIRNSKKSAGQSKQVAKKKPTVISTPLKKKKDVLAVAVESSAVKKGITSIVKRSPKKASKSPTKSKKVRFSDTKSPMKKKASATPKISASPAASSGALTAFMTQSSGFRGGALTAFMKRPLPGIEEPSKEAAFTAIKSPTKSKKATKSPTKSKKATITPTKSPAKKQAALLTPVHADLNNLRGKYNETDRLKIGKYASEHGISFALIKFKCKFPVLKYPTVQVFRNRYWSHLAEAKRKGHKKSKLPGSKNPSKVTAAGVSTKKQSLVVKAKNTKTKGNASTIKSRRLVKKAKLVKAKAKGGSSAIKISQSENKAKISKVKTKGSVSAIKGKQLVNKKKINKAKSKGSASAIKSRRLVDKAKIVKAKARVAKAKRESKAAGKTTLRRPYHKYTEKERFKIGKYASEHGDIASAKKFMDSGDLRVSTVHYFKNMYEADLSVSRKGHRKSLGKSETTGTKRRLSKSGLAMKSPARKKADSSLLKNPAKIKVEYPGAPRSININVESPALKKSTKIKVDPVLKNIKKEDFSSERPWKYLSSNNRYQCQVCGQQLKQKKHFRYHMMIHTEEKPHECTLCGLRTRSKSNMNRHMKRVHPGSATYQCKKCKKNFKSSKYLAIHTKTQKCKKCK